MIELIFSVFMFWLFVVYRKLKEFVIYVVRAGGSSIGFVGMIIVSMGFRVFVVGMVVFF